MAMSKKKKAASRPRRSGPRGAGADVRGVLLAAGHALYQERGFDSVSLRDVADRAGVNQAMVRYYFKDKQGYLAAMLDHGFERLFLAAAAETDPASAFERVIASLNAMPWLPILMMQSVYVRGDLRKHFLDKHALKIVEIVRRTVQFRAGMDPAYAVLSVLSLLVFPQIARPAISQVFGIRFDDNFAKRFSKHLVKLFDERSGPWVTGRT